MHVPDITALGDLTGKKVLVRAGLNVPIKDGKVANDFRIRKSLETIEFLRRKGARILVTGHIGRDPEESLEPVYEHMKADLPDLLFAQSHFTDETETLLEEMHDGDVVLFENLRSDDREKANDPKWARQWADYADMYVNDAFAAAHRAHTSIVGIPEHIPGYAGLLMAEEVEQLTKGLQPSHPALFILGGAKFATKAPILRMSLDLYDSIFIGGALANDFLKAAGNEVGKSLVSDDAEGIADMVGLEKILIPTDVVVANDEGTRAIKPANEVLPDERILDIGPESVRTLTAKVKEAEFILWNGPLGFYEGGYGESTEAIAEMIAAHQCHSIVGGGDTIAAISKLGLQDDFTFLSTGGGAMLDYMADGSLPGVEALAKTNSMTGA